MALSRKFLEGLGLEEKQVEAVIEANAESIEAIKADRDAFKADAEKVPILLKQLEEAKESPDDDYKAMYEAERKALEDYKAEVEAERTEAKKANLYEDLLTGAGIDAKRAKSILRIVDLGKVELGEDGKLKDPEAISEAIKSEWADFIPATTKKGDKVETPPQIRKETSFSEMSLTDKMSYANEHPADADVLAWLAD